VADALGLQCLALEVSARFAQALAPDLTATYPEQYRFSGLGAGPAEPHSENPRPITERADSRPPQPREPVILRSDRYSSGHIRYC